MRRAALAVALAGVLVSCAHAAQPGDQQLVAHRPVFVEAAGVLLAFAVDPSVVDVTVDAGRLLLEGRRAGDTVVTIVLPGGVASFRVRVDGAPSLAAGANAVDAARGSYVEVGYDTSARRLSTAFGGNGRIGDSQLRVDVETSRQLGPRAGETRTAVPSASIGITSARRSIVVLDQFVQDSPLSLDGVVLRGVHVRQDGLEAHAGIASWSPLEGFLASGGERAATLSRRTDVNGLRVTPRLDWFPDSRTRAKAAASVSVDVGTPADPLQLRIDGGVGGGPAAAVQMDLRTETRQAWLRAVYRSREFPALNAARPAGMALDGTWTEKLSAASTLAATTSASRMRASDGAAAHAAYGRIELRTELRDHLSRVLEASAGSYGAGGAPGLRRESVGAGLAWEQARWGLSALYRVQATSASGRIGRGGRISARASADGWRMSAYGDVQQQAPTVGLVLGNRSELARTLASLGIAVTGPEDLLRVLRENASLLPAAGAALGPVRVNPLRTQVGLELAWTGSGPSRPQLGLRVLREHVEGVIGSRRSDIATLRLKWRIGLRTDAAVSVSHWSYGRGALTPAADTGLLFSLRTSFDQPLISATGSSPPIEGRVFKEGQSGDRAPLAGAEVVLDRNRRTRTDTEGRYAFTAPGPGSHSVEAVLPPGEAAYFTTPSRLTLAAGSQGDFGISIAGAVVTGVVTSDAGVPLQGVGLRVQAGESGAGAVTDSMGTFRLAVAPGDVRLSLLAQTLPPGYELRALPAHTRSLRSGESAEIEFRVQALRSVEGIVSGGDGKPATVSMPSTGQSVTTDAAGGFVLHRLPAGAVTLVVRNASGATRETVLVVPPSPGVVRGVRLASP